MARSIYRRGVWAQLPLASRDGVTSKASFPALQEAILAEYLAGYDYTATAPPVWGSDARGFPLLMKLSKMTIPGFPLRAKPSILASHCGRSRPT